ncbi:hypothetical protein [Streptomyces sp. NPDC059171]|uniref:hypothetical protein n=1 Tax=Streptomyces sp. NPDC059171 TaxID=3346755 RepID=UPI0036AEFC6C
MASYLTGFIRARLAEDPTDWNDFANEMVTRYEDACRRHAAHRGKLKTHWEGAEQALKVTLILMAAQWREHPEYDRAIFS